MKYTFEDMSQEDGELLGRIYGKMKERYSKEYRGPDEYLDEMDTRYQASHRIKRTHDINDPYCAEYASNYDEHLIELAALCILAIKEEEGVRHQLQLDREGE